MYVCEEKNVTYCGALIDIIYVFCDECILSNIYDN